MSKVVAGCLGSEVSKHHTFVGIVCPFRLAIRLPVTEPMISALLGQGSINPELRPSFLRRQRRREGRLGVTGPCPCGHWLSVAGAKKGQLNYYHIEKSW